MLGRSVAGGSAKRKFGFKTGWPATYRAVLFRQVDTAIIPGVAIAAFATLHGDERRFAGVRGGMFEEGSGGIVLIFPPDERRERRDASGFPEAIEERGPVAQRDIVAVAERGAGR